MMRHQQHFAGRQQGFEGFITPLPRLVFETRAFVAPYLHPFDMQADAQRIAQAAAACLPGVGVGTQTVVNMNGAQDTAFAVAQGGVRRVQKYRGIQSSAEGHRETAVGVKPGQLFSQGLDSEGHGVRQALRSSSAGCSAAPAALPCAWR